MIYKLLKNILANQNSEPVKQAGDFFAPSNIALVKYWGKRNKTLNLPVTDSISISLAKKGAKTTVCFNKKNKHKIWLNQALISENSEFYKRIADFLKILNFKSYFDIKTVSTVPVASGLASSACGFAALIQALADYFGWELSKQKLSILARLGSGSAARSLWHGFVHWHAGIQADGLDSFAELIPVTWPELCIGLLIVSNKPKLISSKLAMNLTLKTSSLYKYWPDIVSKDLFDLKQALLNKNFTSLGQTSERNALTMHATMYTSQPPIMYTLPETVDYMHRVWEARQAGISIYFTQDAGPNLKLLFLERDLDLVKNYFPDLILVKPFARID